MSAKEITDPKQAAIHDFDFGLIWDYFGSLDRQGPGSAEATLKALSFVDNLSNASKIADLGCGTGTQTFVLAKNTKANITALDLSDNAIGKLNAAAKKLNLHDRVKGVIGSMDALPFGQNEFDIIWSEGAIDEIGFEKGVNYWKGFLKKGGYIAVTNLAWFTQKRPAELEKFYTDAVPSMTTIDKNVAVMQKAGYYPVAVFTLSENCWTDNYFAPQAALNEKFLEKRTGNKTAEAFIEGCKKEAEFYSKYKEYYGYAFYIGKKI